MNDLPLVILGSARKQSDTEKFVREVFQETAFTCCDLLDFEIAPYRYDHTYPETDTFLRLIDTVLEHRVLVFATPVYWYAMSGSMKIFFDRLTDLVTVEKDLGRKLKGKPVFLMAVGADPDLPEGFLIPFRLTANYLKMDFRSGIYQSVKSLLKAEGILLKNRFLAEIAFSVQK